MLFPEKTSCYIPEDVKSNAAFYSPENNSIVGAVGGPALVNSSLPRRMKILPTNRCPSTNLFIEIRP